jgi:hypothetical protein
MAAIKLAPNAGPSYQYNLAIVANDLVIKKGIRNQQGNGDNMKREFYTKDREKSKKSLRYSSFVERRCVNCKIKYVASNLTTGRS